jgi:thymidylate synthase ThyX
VATSDDLAVTAAPDPADDFASPAPVVRLVNAFQRPFDNAVATARTCYASRVITAEEVARDEAATRQRDEIAASTYAAGHHTTLQHAHFQFTLERVSRQLVWSFLHAHPFYNSEQVSQRYVAVKPDRVLVPRLPMRAEQLYRDTVAAQMACYAELVTLLTAPVEEEFFAIFPARRKKAAEHARAIQRRAQEVARYALPVATHAHLYHTVSGLTLHRYHRLCRGYDVPREARSVVLAMVAAVTAVDPAFFARIEDPLPIEETPEHQLLAALGAMRVNAAARAFAQSFDAALGARRSLLVDHSARGEATLAASVRAVLGVPETALGDDAAIAALLSPAENRTLAGPLNLQSLGKLSRALAHVHYTFQKKLSHTADSQDQRHRTTPAARPILHAHYRGGEPDLVLPELLARTPAALDRFMVTMRQTWESIDALLADGVEPELALYLLPNAFPIRFYESGDLAAFRHKWVTRLCYTAQEEIWRASLDEVEQVARVHPRIARYLGPPCSERLAAGTRPYCPEGSRYCGVQVWKLERSEYQRLI